MSSQLFPLNGDTLPHCTSRSTLSLVYFASLFPSWSPTTKGDVKQRAWWWCGKRQCERKRKEVGKKEANDRKEKGHHCIRRSKITVAVLHRGFSLLCFSFLVFLLYFYLCFTTNSTSPHLHRLLKTVVVKHAVTFLKLKVSMLRR